MAILQLPDPNKSPQAIGKEDSKFSEDGNLEMVLTAEGKFPNERKRVSIGRKETVIDIPMDAC
jgi:hypothetical protein